MDLFTVPSYRQPRIYSAASYSSSPGSSYSDSSYLPTPSRTHLIPLLHTAILLSEKGTIVTLLKAGADINGPSSQGLTPLETAIRTLESRESVALLLIELGADIGSRSGSLLCWAARRDWGFVVEALIERGVDVDGHANGGIDTNWDIESCKSMSREVSYTRNRNRRRKPLRRSRGNGITPLHIAAYYSSLSAAKVLIHHGASLSISSQSAELALAEAISNTCIPMVTLLLSSGIDLPSVVDATGGTPLMAAVCMNHVGLVECLMKFGAGKTMGCRDRNGERVWHVGARWAGVEVLEVLRDWGERGRERDVKLRNEDGETPLDLAFRLRRPMEVVDALLSAGARRNDEYGETVMSGETERQRSPNPIEIYDRKMTRYEYRLPHLFSSSSARGSSPSRSSTGSLSPQSDLDENLDRRMVKISNRYERHGPETWEDYDSQSSVGEDWDDEDERRLTDEWGGKGKGGSRSGTERHRIKRTGRRRVTSVVSFTVYR